MEDNVENNLLGGLYKNEEAEGNEEDCEININCIKDSVRDILGIDDKVDDDLLIRIVNIGFQLNESINENKDISRFFNSLYENIGELLETKKLIDNKKKSETDIFKKIVRGISEYLGLNLDCNIKTFFTEASLKIDNLIKIYKDNEDIVILRGIRMIISTSLKEIELNESKNDGLSGLYQRGKGIDVINERRENIGSDKEVYLGIFDIDDFKKINDKYGHPGGDKVISAIGKLLKAHFKRSSDINVRYGGEEFLVYHECKSKQDESREDLEQDEIRDNLEKNALNHLESFINKVRELEIDLGDGNTIKIQISGGIINHNKNTNLEEGIEKADKLLYEVKKGGKNRFIVKKKNGEIIDIK